MIFLVVVSAGFMGCATTNERKSSDTSSTQSDGLVRVEPLRSGALFLHPEQDIDSYDTIRVAELGIQYADGQRPLEPKQHEEVRKMLIRTVVGIARTRGNQPATEPGPCTLDLHTFLVDLEFAESSNVGSQTRVIDSYGMVTVVTEIRDSTTGTPLLRYVRRRSLGSGVQAGPLTPSLPRLERTMRVIFEDMSNQIQKYRAKVPGDSRRALGCEGVIGQLRRARDGKS